MAVPHSSGLPIFRYFSSSICSFAADVPSNPQQHTPQRTAPGGSAPRPEAGFCPSLPHRRTPWTSAGGLSADVPVHQMSRRSRPMMVLSGAGYHVVGGLGHVHMVVGVDHRNSPFLPPKISMARLAITSFAFILAEVPARPESHPR